MKTALAPFLALALLLILQITAAASSADPFAFLTPDVVFGADDLQRLDRGEAIARVLPASGREVTLVSAVAVSVDGNRLTAWVRKIADLKRSALVPSIGRFSDPPRLEDLAGLSLGAADLKALQHCRPDDCDLKLRDSEIDQVQRTTRNSADSNAALQDAFRRVLLERVRAYLAGGQSAIEGSRGGVGPASPQVPSLVREWSFLDKRMPWFVSYLERFPVAPSQPLESFFYWSTEQLGGRTVVRVTHVATARGAALEPDALVAGLQIFASRYLSASLGLTAILRGTAGSPSYLVYLNRSSVDVVGGFFGGLVRFVVERRLKAEASEVLYGLRSRLESGEPQ